MHQEADPSGDPADEIARHAVRVFAGRRAASIDDAVELAMRELRLPPKAVRPTRAQLRAHAQALEESEGGEAARLLRIDETAAEVLRVLSLLEEFLVTSDADAADHPAPRVYGRAARLEFDLDPTVRLRVVTALPSHRIAQWLSDAGLGETTVGTLRTKHGMLDEIRFETALAAYAIARIPPRARIDPALDLVRGNPVESVDFEELLRRTPRRGEHG